MTDQQLFEVAAKLHNLRPDQLPLKKRYLDVVVIETFAGEKYTYFVVDLEKIAAGDVTDKDIDTLLASEARQATGPAPSPPAPLPILGEESKKPQHTRRR